MARTITIVCACGCGQKKDVRVADVRRGWGKYASKSCKAKHQEAKTGQYASYIAGQCRKVGGTRSRSSEPIDEYEDSWSEYADSIHPFSSEALGQD